MKIFWSWQSDHPGRISRHFVRGVLESAVKEVNESPEIQDAEREITLDHDRKGVPGSPDLARTILQKIRASDIVVADVTPVGVTESDPPKKLINSNVAIEIGHALAAPGDGRLIMVMNGHYGGRVDLPFDLAHKAGPLMYRLAPNATAEDMKKARKAFLSEVKAAIRAMLPTISGSRKEFLPIPSLPDDPSRYFKPREPLVFLPNGHGERTPFRVPHTPLFYIRVMPSTLMQPLKFADALDIIRRGPLHLEPFYHRRGSLRFALNEHGAITFEANPDECEILVAAQLFLNREIWAFNATFLHPDSHLKLTIPTLSVEQAFAIRLREYLEFAKTKLGVQTPVRLEGGACGVKDYALGVDHNGVWGPILRDRVIWSGQLASLDAEKVDIALLGIFETLFDAAGRRRPKGLYDFPGSTSGAVPTR